MQPRTQIAKGLCTNLMVREDSSSPPVLVHRHRYRCWLCKYEGVLEFEPDSSAPGWTECHHCGIDNEIPGGVYQQPLIIAGHVPSRMF